MPVFRLGHLSAIVSLVIEKVKALRWEKECSIFNFISSIKIGDLLDNKNKLITHSVPRVTECHL
jgi:hypothetical protein